MWLILMFMGGGIFGVLAFSVLATGGRSDQHMENIFPEYAPQQEETPPVDSSTQTEPAENNDSLDEYSIHPNPV